jgi:hypothetical protein
MRLHEVPAKDAVENTRIRGPVTKSEQIIQGRIMTFALRGGGGASQRTHLLRLRSQITCPRTGIGNDVYTAKVLKPTQPPLLHR